MEYWDSGHVRHVRRGPGVPKRTILAALLAAGGVAAGFAALEGMPVDLPGYAAPPVVGEAPDGSDSAPSDGASDPPWIWPPPGDRQPTPGPRPRPAPASPFDPPAGTPTRAPRTPTGGAAGVGLVPMGTRPAPSPTPSPSPTAVPSPSDDPTATPDPSTSPSVTPSPRPDPYPDPSRSRKKKKP